MSLHSPIEIQIRLEQIEQDLATRQNEYEKVTEEHYESKRERERLQAIRFTEAAGTVAERHAKAVELVGLTGSEEEAKHFAQKAAVGVLEARATILQSLLKAQR